MSNHVWIGEVEYDKGILSRVDGLTGNVANLRSLHRRRQVVRGHFKRRYELADFAIFRWFFATIEKIGDVSIFLGFCCMELAYVMTSQNFRQCMVYLGRVHSGSIKCYWQIKAFIVFGQ